MDRFSNLEQGPAPTTSGSFGTAAAAAMAPQKQSAAIQFPGEDGGRSLAAWARRDLEATLQLLADRAQYITGGSGAAIALRDGEHIICRASSGPSAPEVGSYLQVSSGLSGESVRTRKILSCDNAAMDPRVNHESCRTLGIASFIVMPLVRGDEVIGIFEVFSAQPHAFQERDVQALERMGEMVNTALDQVKNARFKPASRPQDTQKIRVPLESTGIAEILNSGPRPEASAAAVPSTATVHAAALPAAPAQLPESLAKPAPAVGTCASCGFPVSPGRAFCLDCESSLPEKFGRSKDAPAFLTDLGDGGPAPSGFKQWIIAHRYLLGTIAVLGGTAALLLLR